MFAALLSAVLLTAGVDPADSKESKAPASTQEKQTDQAEQPVTNPQADSETPTKPRLGGKKPRLRRDGDEKPKTDKPNADDLAPPSENDRGIPAPEKEMPTTDLDKELLEGLGQDLEQVPQEEADPLMRVGRRMRDVEERLARLDATDKTIEEQRKILEDLDELLKQAQNNNQNNKQNQNQKRQQQQQQQQQQSEEQRKAQQQNENQQANRDQAGPPRRAGVQEPANPLQTKDVWGHLSAMLRDEMSQYAKEGFLPKYRDLLEKYYSDIAERSRSQD